MSLRRRLLLVLLAVVATMGLVVTATTILNRSIQREVAGLAPIVKSPLLPEHAVGLALAGDGQWRSEGWFQLDDIERLSVTRRPKLRGAIQAIDASTFTLFGVAIRTTPNTEFADHRDMPDPVSALRVGQRVEVSCSVAGDGAWTARKVSLSPTKSSDKIKGTVTAAQRAADGGIELSVHGLRLRASGDARISGPQGPLHQIANATEMNLELQECLAAAHELLAQRYRERELRNRGSSEAVDTAIDAAQERLQDAYESFAETIARGLSADAGNAAAEERARLQSLVADLDRQRAGLHAELDNFRRTAAGDPDAAEQILRAQIEPRVRTRVLPLVQTHQLRTEEALTEELRAIAAHAQNAASLGLLANGLGLALALALGLIASRSITRPLQELRDAATRIGRGELATRVELPGHDEIGTLANTMNKMAAELAASTVSVSKLSGVLDSMASALLLLDADRTITAANPAAGTLLGYRHEELRGRPFAQLCSDATALRSSGTPLELELLGRNGQSVSVSLSSAELRDPDGTARGFVCVAQDLTARKALEQQLRGSIRDQELLLREIHHRVKNSLQVISSLLALQARDVTDPAVLDLFQESQDRIQSLVFIHDQLYRTRQRGQVDLRAYLGLLATHLAQVYATRAGSPVALSVAIEPISLDIDRAQACGLLVNELLTNAYKHAFSGRDGGKLNLSCRRTESDHVILEVQDDGHGFATAAPGERGERIGMTLIETLVRQLHGTLQVEHHPGARVRVTFALTSPVAPA